MSAPTSDETPPTAATTPSAAGPRPSSSTVNSHHVVPKMPQIMEIATCEPANARRIGSWRTSRMPSRISAITGDRSAAGGGGGSSLRIVPRRTAETRNVTASMAIVTGALSTWTSTPPSPNARTSEAEPLADRAAFASVSCSRSTTVGR